jgi:hypothetical protein
VLKRKERSGILDALCWLGRQFSGSARSATRSPTGFSGPSRIAFADCGRVTGIYEKVIKVKADVAAVLD